MRHALRIMLCSTLTLAGVARATEAGSRPEFRLLRPDEDWSALRFRRVEYIKALRRNPAGAISAAGKRKAAVRKG